MRPIKSGCPTCAADARAKEEARKEREALRERQHRVAQLRNNAGIPQRFAAREFADYATTVPAQRRALGVCKAFAEAWPETLKAGASLVLTGGPGTGKTHLACAVGNAVMETHLAAVAFGTVAGLLRHIKDTYRKDSDRSEQDAIDDLVRPDLLIVDEVGVQVGSEHEKLLMFEVLNSRYQELRPTILISNLNTADLEAFLGQRVMDRYRECGSVLAFDWPSHRGRA
jgi:DNA replication protein DnaC